jgi:hypothetical protein
MRQIQKREKDGIERKMRFIGGHVLGSLWKISAPSAGFDSSQTGTGSKGTVDRNGWGEPCSIEQISRHFGILKGRKQK